MAAIDRARRWRKVLGGGMRQAGLMAAAGLYALQNNVARLAEDHDNARALAEALVGIDGVKVDPAAVQTNMVFMAVAPDVAAPLRDHLARRGMIIPASPAIRLVTHLDVDRDDLMAFAQSVRDFFRQTRDSAARTPAHA
jgi:threonine aldolase